MNPHCYESNVEYVCLIRFDATLKATLVKSMSVASRFVMVEFTINRLWDSCTREKAMSKGLRDRKWYSSATRKSVSELLHVSEMRTLGKRGDQTIRLLSNFAEKLDKTQRKTGRWSQLEILGGRPDFIKSWFACVWIDRSIDLYNLDCRIACIGNLYEKLHFLSDISRQSSSYAKFKDTRSWNSPNSCSSFVHSEWIDP